MTVSWLTRIRRSPFVSLPGSRSPDRIASTNGQNCSAPAMRFVDGFSVAASGKSDRATNHLCPALCKGAGPNDNHNMFDRIVRLHTPFESPRPPGALSTSLATWAEIRLQSHACTRLLKCQISVPREPSLLQLLPVDSSAVQMFLVNAEGDSHNRQLCPQRR